VLLTHCYLGDEIKDLDSVISSVQTTYNFCIVTWVFVSSCGHWNSVLRYHFHKTGKRIVIGRIAGDMSLPDPRMPV